ncbi:MAG TPA: hypothetical protein VEA16_15485 [Vicinamibacterales bacterium]|nr:hypothetical protein [Vicinamibacterales bacterium]
MNISFDHACDLVEAVLRGDTRRRILAGLRGTTLGASLSALRDAMRANRFRAGSAQFFLDRMIKTYDGRTRGDGFHILHDWDGVAQQTNPDIIPIDVLQFVAEQRGAEESSDLEPAILLDYYFMHVLALLTMRVWDEGDASGNVERLNALVGELQGPNGSGQQFAADAATLMLIGTSHYEPHEWGYGKLLARVRTLDEAHQFRIGLGHASSMGCHLRFGFEAQCGRDTVLLRDDNIADYPWLCFALAAVSRAYVRLAGAGIENRDRGVIEEAMLNGLTADARAFIGVPPPSLSESEADRLQFVEHFVAHKSTLLEAFTRYRPSDTAYSPLSLFFNFSHNVVKGTVVDALLWGEAWDVTLDDLLSGVPRADQEDGSRQLLATTLMAYARSNPDRIRGRLMPVIVYDPQAGRRAFTVAMEKLSQ